MDDLASLAPAHRIVFPESTDIVSAVFSKDGSTVFVHIKPETINVWHIVHAEWAIVLGAVLFVLLAGCFLWVVRVLRRRRARGSLYCRGCNYCVDGQPEGAPCPECGRSLGPKAVVRGVPAWRRLVVPSVVAVVLSAGYAAMHVTGVPPGAKDWLQWHSTSLVPRTATMPRFNKHAAERDRIMVLDAESGKRLRVLTTQPSVSYAPLELTADGRHVILANRWSVKLIDVRSGRVWRALRPIGGAPMPNMDMVLGVDGTRVLLSMFDIDQKVDRLCVWDYEAGTLETVYEHEAFLRDEFPIGRDAVVLSMEPLRVLSTPSFMENFQNPEFVVRDIALEGGVGETLSLSPLPNPSASPVYDPVSGLVFFSARWGVHGFDVETGEHAGLLQLNSVKDDLCVHAGRRWLVVVSHEQIFIRHIDDRRWVAQLSYPDVLVAPKPYLSEDGRRLAAIGFQSTGQQGVPPGGYVHELLIYDLSELD